MNKYSDIEIQTAKNLLKEGYKWIARNGSGRLFAYYEKPTKADTGWYSLWYPIENSGYICKESVSIFQNIRSDDKEPTSLGAIVHPPILDNAEKRYLENVIKPFRDDAVFIMKHQSLREGVEQIIIGYKSDLLDARFYFSLPPFKRGDMYEGMESDLKYSLEELGL